MRTLPRSNRSQRAFIVCPFGVNRFTDIWPQVEGLVERAEAAGYESVLVVDRSLSEMPATDAPVLRLLDAAEPVEKHWLERDPRNVALELPGGLSNHLLHLVENLDAGSKDLIFLVGLSLAQVDQAWQFLLSTGAGRPRLHLDIASMDEGFVPSSVVVRQLWKRFTSLGVLEASTVTMSSLHVALAGDFDRHGMSCVHAATLAEAFPSDSWSVPDEQSFVVHVAPSWAGQGASQVFETQLRYVHFRGYASLVVHVSPTDLTPVDSRRVREELAAGLPAFGAAHRWLVVREDADEVALGLRRPYELPHLSFEGEARVAMTAAVPRSLQRALTHRKVDWVLCNYGHLVPMVSGLGLSDVPLVTETHDIRPVQHSLNNDLPVEQLDLEAERRNWGRSDGVVFINDLERRTFVESDEHPATVTAFPFGSIGQRIIEPDSFRTVATSLLRSDGGATNPALVMRLVDELLAGRDDSEIRCLYVGSDHRANVDSLNWYLEHVHLERLQHQPIRLLVAGSIDRAYRGNKLRGVDFLGRVDDLKQLYDLVDVVILPIVEGTGLPIKMIDAINAEALFVPVSGALAAVPELSAALTAYDAPEAFAARVIDLATNESEATEFRQSVISLKGQVGSWRRYVETWDEVTQLAGVSHPVTTLPDIASPWPDESFERAWRPERCTPQVNAFATVGLDVIGDNVSVVERYARFVVACDEPSEALVRVEFYNPSDVDRLIEWFSAGRALGATRLAASSVTAARLQVEGSIVDGHSVAVVELLECELDGVIPPEQLALKSVGLL